MVGEIMNEDMSDMLKNLNNMMQNKEIPDNVQNMLGQFLNSQKNTSNKEASNDNPSNPDISSDMPEIDINMLMKMKDIMQKMKSNSDDPRANLLRSLKPYLKSSRKEKVDQYIQLFNMTKVIDLLGPLGGDKKNDV